MLRVSTEKQTVENQRPDVDRLVAARGFELVEVYEEQESAVKVRPEFDRMMCDAKRGRFTTLVIWSVDRFGRGALENLLAVRELDRVGVQVVSAVEPWLDTSGPFREPMLYLISWLAEQERKRLIERTKAGLETVRRKHGRLGRPFAEERHATKNKGVRLDVHRALALIGEGKSVRAAARDQGASEATLRRALRRAAARG
jgi:DNA invertase Pin-like site-specific DNA recombinase